MARLSTSSLPASYHLSLQEELDSSSPQLFHRVVSLAINSQDIHLLSCKVNTQRRCLPPDPTASGVQRTLSALTVSSTPDRHTSPPSLPVSSPHSSSECSLPPSPPSSPPPPPPPQDIVYPTSVDLPPTNAFRVIAQPDNVPSAHLVETNDTQHQSLSCLTKEFGVSSLANRPGQLWLLL